MRPELAPVRRATRAARWGIPAALLLLGALPYSNTFASPFAFDDRHQILDNPLIRDLPAFFDSERAAATGASADRLGGLRSRWLAYFTFALNYRLGGFDVAGWHAVNLAIHLLAGLLLFRLVRRTLELPRFDGSILRGRERETAFFSSAFFLVHPIQTQAVTYLVQRMASLAAMLCLAALAAWLEARTAAGARRRVLFAVLAVLASLAAMVTKENAATFPLLIALYDLAFLSGPRRRRLLALLPVLATALVVPVRLLAGGATLASSLAGVRADTSMERLTYLLTQFRVIATYLRLLVWPAGQNLDHDYPLARSFAQRPVALSFLLLVALAGFGVLLLLRPRRGGDPAWRWVGFGVVWFFVALAVESSLVPIRDVIVEHRLYLPSAGLLSALTATVLLVRPAPRFRIAIAALAFVTLALATATFARNRVWRSELALWRDTAEKSPNKSRPLNCLGAAWQVAGRPDLAFDLYQRAVAADPANFEAVVNLGSARFARGETREAARLLVSALELDPGSPTARARLVEALAAAARRPPVPGTGSDEARAALAEGARLRASGRILDAVLRYERALSLHPWEGPGWNNLGNLYRDAGLRELAVVCFTVAVELAPRDAIALNSLGVSLRELGRTAEAEAAFRAAVQSDPSYASALNNLGNLLRGLGRTEEAVAALSRALDLDPRNPVIRSNLEAARRERQGPRP
ncbi:MAG: tetratricopeptide repeat protein [Thermoanaerobaculia bacterium]|nr:MAG: tetratricopeptide repeat protein [Thermoanaerobaculia bacterium]